MSKAQRAQTHQFTATGSGLAAGDAALGAGFGSGVAASVGVSLTILGVSFSGALLGDDSLLAEPV